MDGNTCSRYTHCDEFIQDGKCTNVDHYETETDDQSIASSDCEPTGTKRILVNSDDDESPDTNPNPNEEPTSSIPTQSTQSQARTSNSEPRTSTSITTGSLGYPTTTTNSMGYPMQMGSTSKTMSNYQSGMYGGPQGNSNYDSSQNPYSENYQPRFMGHFPSQQPRSQAASDSAGYGEGKRRLYLGEKEPGNVWSNPQAQRDSEAWT